MCICLLHLRHLELLMVCYTQATPMHGATETCGAISLNLGGSLVEDNIGIPGITTQFKIENKPELGYEYEKNKSGELLVRGGAIFSAYYKDPEATKEAFDEYGFYRTGDIVILREDEKFQIIGRAKNFFKLTQGEFVSSESAENEYLAKFSDWFTQVWITGENDQSFTVGLFAVNRDKLARFAQHYGLDVEDIDIDDLGLKRVFYGKIMKPVCNDESFQVKGFEKVKNFKLFSGDFMTINNDTLTTTMKIRRHKAKQVFKDDIKELYEEGEL